MNEIKRLLAPLQKKLLIEGLLNKLIIGVSVSALINIIILIFSKFIYIRNQWLIMVIIFFLGIFFSVIFAFIKRDDIKKIARVGDKLGLKERLSTTIEILEKKEKLNNMNEIDRLLISDTIAKTKQIDLWRKYKIKYNRRNLIVAGLLCVSMLITGFIPYKSSSAIEEIKAFDKNIESAVKYIDTKMKEIEPKVKTTEKTKLLKEIEDTKKLLKEAKNKAEATETLQKAQENIMKVANESKVKETKTVKETLNSNSATEKLGLGTKTSSKEITENMQNLSSEKKEELQKLLEEAKAMSNSNGELSEAISDLSIKLSEGATDASELGESVEKLDKIIQAQLAEKEELDKTTDNINSTLSSAQNSLSESGSQIANKTQNGGQNAQNQSEGQGSGRGRGHIDNTDKYSREGENLSSSDINIKGDKTENGITQQIEVKTIGQDGGEVSYKEVYQQYKEDALSTLDNDEIPQGMQKLIKEYFSTLD